MNTNNSNTELFFDVQQKTDKQHILDNPDTYIGSVESIDADMWIMSEDDNKIIEKILITFLDYSNYLMKVL